MPTIPETTRQWVIKKKPGDGPVSADNFELKTDVSIFDSPREGKILVKVLYISTDPGARTWMDEGPFNHRPYLPPVMQVGAKVFAGGVGEVVESYHPDWQKGDKVFAHFGWTEYALHDPSVGYPAQKVPQGMTPQEFLVLELTAQAAYFGFYRLGDPTADTKTVVISAAAGGIGILVAQIAKRVLGIPNVIGIVGSDEKAKKLTDLGYVDVALNYRSPTFEEDFAKATPNYVDIYFDNVGGRVLALNMKRIAVKGKIIFCGAISYYEREQKIEFEPEAFMQIIHQQASFLGFLVVYWYHEIPRMLSDMTGWHEQGKLDYVYDERDLAFEQVPEGFRVIFDGQNFGKNILKIA